MKKTIIVMAMAMLLLAGASCQDQDQAQNTNSETVNLNSTETDTNIVENVNSSTSNDEVKIIFLHHSTGKNIWNGGVEDWFKNWNTQQSTNYQIEEMDFPTDEYGWQNYPYDYWNIWVNHADQAYYQGQPTLDTLADDYDVIVWKHCYPVSEVEPALEDARVSAEYKSVANYKLQYEALKTKMKEYPDTKFVVWTGAAQPNASIDSEQAGRAQEFFDWVRYTWDETGDNIYVWDFYHWETQGGLYMLDEYAEDPSDPHPNSSFSATIAKYFAQRVVSVIEGNGDLTNIIGK